MNKDKHIKMMEIANKMADYLDKNPEPHEKIAFLVNLVGYVWDKCLDAEYNMRVDRAIEEYKREFQENFETCKKMLEQEQAKTKHLERMQGDYKYNYFKSDCLEDILSKAYAFDHYEDDD
jgi:hypothetical protein